MSTMMVDGQPIAFESGDSIAAALLRSGIVAFRRSLSGEPRGLFCGIGVCNDCLVTVDGRPNRRACLTPAVAEAVIQTGARPR